MDLEEYNKPLIPGSLKSESRRAINALVRMGLGKYFFAGIAREDDILAYQIAEVGFRGYGIYDLIATPQEQLRLFRRWNKERGWGFTSQDIKGIGPPPVWKESRCPAVPVLEINLDTSDRTLSAAWDCLSKTWKVRHHSGDLGGDFGFDLRGDLIHQPGIRWRLMEIQRVPESNLHNYAPTKQSPSAALWAIAFSPKLIATVLCGCDHETNRVALIGYNMRVRWAKEKEEFVVVLSSWNYGNNDKVMQWSGRPRRKADRFVDDNRDHWFLLPLTKPLQGR